MVRSFLFFVDFSYFTLKKDLISKGGFVVGLVCLCGKSVAWYDYLIGIIWGLGFKCILM